jgi:hypothetical protein
MPRVARPRYIARAGGTSTCSTGRCHQLPLTREA